MSEKKKWNDGLEDALADLRQIETDRQAKLKLEAEQEQLEKVTTEQLSAENDSLYERLQTAQDKVERKSEQIGQLISQREFFVREVDSLSKQLQGARDDLTLLSFEKKKTPNVIKLLLILFLAIAATSLMVAHTFSERYEKAGVFSQRQFERINELEMENGQIKQAYNQMEQIAMEIGKRFMTCEKQLAGCMGAKAYKKQKKEEEKEEKPRDIIPSRPSPAAKSKKWVKLCDIKDPLGCLDLGNARDL